MKKSGHLPHTFARGLQRFVALCAMFAVVSGNIVVPITAQAANAPDPVTTPYLWKVFDIFNNIFPDDVWTFNPAAGGDIGAALQGQIDALSKWTVKSSLTIENPAGDTILDGSTGDVIIDTNTDVTGDLDVDGTATIGTNLNIDGDVTINTNGSTEAVPRLFNVTDLSNDATDYEAFRLQLGGAGTGLQIKSGGALDIFSKSALRFIGGRGAIDTAPTFDSPDDVGLEIINTVAGSTALGVKGAVGQTADLQQWQTSDGTVLSVVDKDGYFGIDVIDPVAKLDIGGEIKVLPLASPPYACEAPTKGTIYYDSNNDELLVCDGSSWISAASASVAAPGSDKQLLYNNSTVLAGAQLYYDSGSLGGGSLGIGSVRIDGSLRIDANGQIGATEFCDADGGNCYSMQQLAAAATQWDNVTGGINYPDGNVGVGVLSPTAFLELAAGTATNPPLKLTAGTNLTTPEAGSFEYNGSKLFFSPNTTRETIAFLSDLAGINVNDADADPNNELQNLDQVLTLGKNAGGKVINNIGTPLVIGDAANKGYVDGKAATASTWGNITGTLGSQTDLQNALNTKLNLAGGTLTGNLVLNADPAVALGAATKQYVDTKASGAALADGNKGDITVSGSGATWTINTTSIKDTMVAWGTGAGQVSADDIPDGTTNKMFTLTERTKLIGIETGADVTDATNVKAAGAVMIADTATTGMGFVIDEDTFASDLDTKVPTQQSVKAYVDSEVSAAGTGALQNLEQVLTKGNDGGNLQIKNIADPTDPQDAVNKRFVESVGSGALQDLGEVLTEGNNAGGLKISNLADPTLAQDATTKSYVDGKFVNKSGDTMTGELILPGTPASASGAVPKSYVDNLINGLTWKDPVDDNNVADGLGVHGTCDAGKESWASYNKNESIIYVCNGTAWVQISSTAGLPQLAGDVTGDITSNVIANNAVNSAKIADGTITTGDIADGTIANADVSATAAIAGTKVSPNFGSQNVVTTGSIKTNRFLVDGADVSATPGENEIFENGGTMNLAARSSVRILLDNDNTQTNASFQIGTDGNYGGLFHVGEDGKVGIGTITPAEKLEVVGKIKSSSTVAGDAGTIVTTKDYVDAKASGAALADGDKGDVTVSGSGATWTIDNGTVTSAKLADDSIVNADINSAAAIAGTKISPDFGAQNVVTTGKVGVGMTNPAEPLTIQTTDGEWIGLIDNGGNKEWRIKEQGGGDLGFTEHGVADNRLVLKAGGNVGIGTASPTGALHIAGSAVGTKKSSIILDKTNISATNWLQWNVGNLGNFFLGQAYNDPNYGLSMYAGTSNTAASPGTLAMYVNTAGNVGIGTAAPTERLEVAGGADFDYRRNLGGENNSTNSAGWYKFGKLNGTNGTRFSLRILGSDGYGQNDIDQGETIIIGSFGNNGNASRANIQGTWYSTSGQPVVKAIKFVENGGRYSYDVYGDFFSYSKHSVFADMVDGSWTDAWSSVSDPGADSVTVAAALNQFNITRGDVGIGTTSPLAKLDVDGKIRSQSTVAGDAGTTVTTKDYVDAKAGAAALADGDKGDVTVSGSGATWAIDAASIKDTMVAWGTGVGQVSADDVPDGTTNKMFTLTERTKLIGIETGADVTDATNVAAAGALMKSGGTMTGNLVLNADPTVALGAASKQYVDNLINGLTWKAPVATDAATTYGACDAGKESWATFNKSDNIIYVCNGTAWVQMSSSVGIPQMAGDVTGNITSNVIANDAVTSAKIADGTIVVGDIADNAITSAKVALDTLVAADIAAGAIGNSELASNAVTNVKVSATAAIDGTKINPNFGSQNVVTTGKIGVGTTSPAYDLEVYNNTTGGSLMVGSSVANLNSSVYLYNSDYGIRRPASAAQLDFLSASRFNWSSNGVDVMRLDGGKLGIGTTNPGQKLEVAGKIKSDSTLAGDAGTIVTTKDYVDAKASGAALADGDKGDVTVTGSGATWTIDDSTITSNKIVDGTIANADINSAAAIAGTKISPNFGAQNLIVDTNLLFADATGNYVGIGTATPVHKLDVVNGDIAIRNSLGDARLIVDSSGNNFDSILSFRRSSLADTAQILVNHNDASAQANSLQFATGLGALTTKMIISETGNVGIGTTNPTQKLEVAGKIKSASTQGTDAGTTVATKDYVDAQATAATLPDGDKGDITVANSGINWTIDDNAVNSAKLANDSIVNADINSAAAIAGTKISPDFGAQNVVTTGSVGIGTTSPSAKLHIDGGGIKFQSNSAFGAGTGNLSFDSNTKALTMYNDYANDTSRINFDMFNGSQKTIMSLSRLGNVGIGTTNPSTALSFDGASNKAIAMERASSGAGNGLEIKAGGAASGTSNTDGGYLTLSSGISTGNVGSGIIFKTALGGQGLGATDRSPTEIMRISHLGRLGIGTSAPYNKVDVAGNMAIGSGYAGTQTAPANGLIVQGKVGIGTSTPNSLLHVKTNTGTNAEIDIQSGSAPHWGIYQDETSKDLNFWNTANVLTLTDEGNVNVQNTLDMTSGKIVNLLDPTAAQDAATKAYVDTKSGAASTWGNIMGTLSNQTDLQNALDAKLALGGGTMTGNLILNADPTVPLGAVTKQYVDAIDTNDADSDPTNEMQNLDEVLTKGKDAGGKVINNVGTPLVAGDVANKGYVDDLINGLTWKAPVTDADGPTGGLGSYGTCDGTKQSWAVYNKSDNIIYVCNGSAWVQMSSTVGIPNLAGDVTGNITSNVIANNAVTSAKIADGTIATGDIADNAINSAKIQDGTVTGTDILDATIANVDVSATAAIAGTKISPNFGSQVIQTTGNLAIDTNVLFADAATNNVGIGTATPGYKLDVSGSMRVNKSVYGRTAFSSSNYASRNYVKIFSHDAPPVSTTGNAYIKVAINGHSRVQGRAIAELQISGRNDGQSYDVQAKVTGVLENKDIIVWHNTDLGKYEVYLSTLGWTWPWEVMEITSNIVTGAIEPTFATTTTLPNGSQIWSLATSTDVTAQREGNFGIGTVTPTEKLEVVGKIKSASTVAGDAGTTVTTKDYVDSKAAGAALADGDKGDVTVSGSGATWTIDAASIKDTMVAWGTGAGQVSADDVPDGTTNKMFTLTERTKLIGIETGADVTDATNVDAAGATMNTDTNVKTNTWVIDEDTFASNLDTKVPTQQSVKAYVDTKSSAAALADGDKGDVTVSGSGATWTIDNGTITSAKLLDGTIANADISATAAIAGTKIAPNFGSQDVVTTGKIGVGTTTPNFDVDVRGTLAVVSGIGNAAARPAVTNARIAGEITGVGTGPAMDDGFLRLSAGGGTSGVTKTWIDLSGYSTVPDMNRNITFGTNGGERMRIDASGNVGIGTVSSGQKLEVAGKIKSTSTVDGDVGTIVTTKDYVDSKISGSVAAIATDEIKDADGNTKVQVEETANEDKIRFDTAGTERMIIDNSGNVSIGTSLSANKLEVENNLRVSSPTGQPTIVAESFGTNQSAILKLLPTGTGSGIIQSSSALMFKTNNAEQGRFHTNGNFILGAGSYPGDNGAKLQVTGDSNFSGKVGIGTTTPAAGAKLDVNGEVYSTGSAGGSFRALNPLNQSANVGLGWLNDVARIRVGGSGNGATNGFDIQTTGDVSLLRVLGNGNVGIGITSPSTKLHVVTSNTSANTVDSSTEASTRITGGSSQTLLIGDDANGTQINSVSNSDFSVERQLVLNAGGGNVGVGTTSPQSALDVNGDLTVSGVINGGADMVPNLVRNSYMNILDGSVPAGYSGTGVTIEAVSAYTKGFEGCYQSSATSPCTAASPESATEAEPYWFGVYDKGDRIRRGGLESGWHTKNDGNILKVTATGKVAGEHSYVSLPFEENVLGAKWHFKAWVKIVKGSQACFGSDAGYQGNPSSTCVTKATADAATDGWYRFNGTATSSQITSLDNLAFSFGAIPDASGDVEMYVALPYVANLNGFGENKETWMPSVSDTLSRNGMTIHPVTDNVGIGTTNPSEKLEVAGKIKSASTEAGDAGTTVTTKDYVDAKAGAAALADGDKGDVTVSGSGATWSIDASSVKDTMIAWGTGATQVSADDIPEGTTNKMFTLTERTKLVGIESGADVTDATNVDAAGAVMNSDASTASMSFVVDEDDMTSNSATKVPTQQSVKTYVDNLINGLTWKAPVATSAATTYGACDASKESWATFNKSDNIIYVCNGSAWVEMSSTVGIPALAGDVTGNITSNVIANDAVTSAKIADGTIVVGDIADNAITSAKVALDTLVAADIAAGAIGNSELASNAVTNVKVSATAAIDGTKINPNFGSQVIQTTGNLAIDTNVLFADAATNNVGIGTATPGYKLDVNGSARLNKAVYSMPAFSSSNYATRTYIKVYSQNAPVNVTQGTTYMRVNINGHARSQGRAVAELVISGRDFNVQSNLTGVLADKDIIVWNNTDNGKYEVYLSTFGWTFPWEIVEITSNVSSGAIESDPNSTATTTLPNGNQVYSLATDTNTLTLSEGNVGIGTVTPISKLQVTGSATLGTAFTPNASTAGNILNLLAGSTADGSINGISFFESTASGFGMKLGYDGVGTGSDNALRFYSDANAALVTIDNGGKVGIGTGTATPGAKLEVVGKIKSDSTLAGDAATTVTTKDYVDAKASSAALADGDKGDVTVSASGATWTIDAGTINSSKITDNSVATGDILDGTIATGDIADNAITNAKMADNAIGLAEMLDNSVGSTELINDSIMNVDVNSAAAIAGTKISPDFGSQNVVTTGIFNNWVTLGNASIAGPLKNWYKVYELTGTGRGLEDIEVQFAGDTNVYNGDTILRLQISRHNTESAGKLHVSISPVSGVPSNGLVKVDGGDIWVASNRNYGTIRARLVQSLDNPGRTLFNTTPVTTEPATGTRIDGIFGVVSYNSDNDAVYITDSVADKDRGDITVSNLGATWTIDNNAVTSSTISDGTIINTDINASAAIAGSKISPDFGAQVIQSTGNLAIGTSKLFVNSSTGKVGIGTATPNSLLHLKTASGNAELDIQSGSAPHWAIYQDGTTQDLNFWNTANHVTFGDNGDVSFDGGAFAYDAASNTTSIDRLKVGSQKFEADAGVISWIDMPVTSSPAQGIKQSYSAMLDGSPVLTVYGEANGTGGTQNTKVQVTGDLTYTGTLTDVSDSRLKDNIKPLEGTSTLDKIVNAKTYSFTMKNDPSKKTEFGVIAQEFEKLFPELVQTMSGEEYGVQNLKTVNYVGLIAPIIESVKELKNRFDAIVTDVTNLTARVETLEAENTSLKAELEAQNARIERLEALLLTDSDE